MDGQVMNRLRIRSLTHALLLAGLALATTTNQTIAESAQDRANKIKEWRENCNDPDPDLRLAFLESAIESGDATIMRTCVRQALTSDNVDMRNLGLRAALAMNERITFVMTLPDHVAEALAEAGTDSKKLNAVQRTYSYTIQPVESIGGIFTLVQSNAAITAPVSEWYTLGMNADNNANYRATLSVAGDQVSGTGRVHLQGDGKLAMLLRLSNEAELVGTVDFGRSDPIPVKAKLF